jgi:hypothetical protein
METAAARLGKWIKPGDKIFSIVRHVSSSGMSRTISLYKIKGDHIVALDYNVSELLDRRLDKNRDGIVCKGCGMDMAFDLVYSMGRKLFPEGFGIMGELNGKKRRPKTKAEAAAMVKSGYKFFGRNGDKSGWDTDGGYALDNCRL